jgi:hypothetical protein
VSLGKSERKGESWGQSEESFKRRGKSVSERKSGVFMVKKQKIGENELCKKCSGKSEK